MLGRDIAATEDRGMVPDHIRETAFNEFDLWGLVGNLVKELTDELVKLSERVQKPAKRKGTGNNAIQGGSSGPADDPPPPTIATKKKRKNMDVSPLVIIAKAAQVSAKNTVSAKRAGPGRSSDPRLARSPPLDAEGPPTKRRKTKAATKEGTEVMHPPRRSTRKK